MLRKHLLKLAIVTVLDLPFIGVIGLLHAIASSCRKLFAQADPQHIEGMAVALDRSDASLNLSVADDLLTASPLASGSLSRLWSGVRANTCASAGKIFFVVNVVKELSGDGDEIQPEALIGVSTRGTAPAQLGCANSWAYASTAQRWTASKAESYGTPYSAGDRIGCFLDLESEPCTLSFSHNEIWLGHAYDVQQPDHSQKALYPHIMLKGLEVQLDFTGDGLVVGDRWPKETSDYVSWTVSGNTRVQ